MKIGRQARLEELDARSWSDFADRAELGQPLVRRRVAEVSARVAEAAEGACAGLLGVGLDDGALERLSALVIHRAQVCRATVDRR